MRRQGTERGQSIVEMALMLPVLIVVLFGIVEFGWLIFAYSTISQAARNGAEVAAQLPPYQEWIDIGNMSDAQREQHFGAAYLNQYPYTGYRSDRCIDAVLTAIESDVTIFGSPDDQQPMTESVDITYPDGGNTRNLSQRGPVEVTVTYPVRGLTPLFTLIGLGDEDGTITMRVVQRRSLENLGRDPTSPTNVACAANPQSYWEINGTQ